MADLANGGRALDRGARKHKYHPGLQLSVAALLSALLCLLVVWCRPRAPVVVAPDYGDAKQITAAVWDGGRTRRVYPLSVVAGGVYNAAEVEVARRADPVIAAHYQDLNVRALRRVVLDEPVLRYVSFRRGNRVYWTRERLPIPRGETVLADGASMVRARCGNRLSEEPREPVLPVTEHQPTVVDFEIPLPPDIAPTPLVLAAAPGMETLERSANAAMTARCSPSGEADFADMGEDGSSDGSVDEESSQKDQERSRKQQRKGRRPRDGPGLKRAGVCLAPPPPDSEAAVAEAREDDALSASSGAAAGRSAGSAAPQPPAGNAVADARGVPGFNGFGVLGGSLGGGVPAPKTNPALEGPEAVMPLNPELFLPFPTQVTPTLPPSQTVLSPVATQSVFAVLNPVGGGAPSSYSLGLPYNPQFGSAGATMVSQMPMALVGEGPFGSRPPAGGPQGQQQQAAAVLLMFSQVSSEGLFPSVIPGMPVSTVLFTTPQNPGPLYVTAGGAGGGGSGGGGGPGSGGGVAPATGAATGDGSTSLLSPDTAVPEPWTVVTLVTGLVLLRRARRCRDG